MATFHNNHTPLILDLQVFVLQKVFGNLRALAIQLLAIELPQALDAHNQNHHIHRAQCIIIIGATPKHCNSGFFKTLIGIPSLNNQTNKNINMNRLII